MSWVKELILYSKDNGKHLVNLKLGQGGKIIDKVTRYAIIQIILIQIRQHSASVNKVLSKCSYIHLFTFMHFLWLFSCCTGWIRYFCRRPYSLLSLKYLLFDPLHKTFSHPWAREWPLLHFRSQRLWRRTTEIYKKC